MEYFTMVIFLNLYIFGHSVLWQAINSSE